jgi:hypothetical protein
LSLEVHFKTAGASQLLQAFYALKGIFKFPPNSFSLQKYKIKTVLMLQMAVSKVFCGILLSP